MLRFRRHDLAFIAEVFIELVKHRFEKAIVVHETEDQVLDFLLRSLARRRKHAVLIVELRIGRECPDQTLFELCVLFRPGCIHVALQRVLVTARLDRIVINRWQRRWLETFLRKKRPGNVEKNGVNNTRLAKRIPKLAVSGRELHCAIVHCLDAPARVLAAL
ncbi:hypothetical protein KBY24_15160 [Ruegeria pomeroyi]|nr:hypothetical protein [Ruegeria pomeroyi]